MRVLGVSLRDFRSYGQAELGLGDGLTVITGPNGAGKTNLLEGLYFGCTGRSCRTTNEREVVRFGASAARIVVRCEDETGAHEVSVGFAPGQPKRLQVDGAAVERLTDSPGRPLVSVFLPDRLELIKGPPAVRRAHLDQVVAALWPGRTQTRRAYAQALAQRNALIARIRAGHATPSSLRAWNDQLAGQAMQLMGDRDQATSAVAETARRIGATLGLEGDLTVSYRRRSRAATAQELVEELEARLDQDLERGFSTHGPHRDDLSIRLVDRELRVYGSQGQQRLGLLSLLLAEREAIAATRTGPPVMLLDDVFSELDSERRRALVERLRAEPGQSLITTTEPDHVPGLSDDVRFVAVSQGQLLESAGVA
jgi:DNA replication and repair protein RecF